MRGNPNSVEAKPLSLCARWPQLSHRNSPASAYKVKHFNWGPSVIGGTYRGPISLTVDRERERERARRSSSNRLFLRKSTLLDFATALGECKWNIRCNSLVLQAVRAGRIPALCLRLGRALKLVSSIYEATFVWLR